ncbi:MAG TPA: hypothetical protein ENI64_08660 [Gammaproteobacteria bacterium]|nr:hypothetical protein [Gammaproteobacteria bacterium]
MNRIFYSLLLPLFMLTNPSASAAGLSDESSTNSQIGSDTNGSLIVASTYSGRRADSLAQQRLRQNNRAQNTRAEFSAFETEQKATTTQGRQHHRYGGRAHDRPRTQH